MGSTAKGTARELASTVVRRFLETSAPPISFRYGGRPSRELLEGWKVTRRSQRQVDRANHAVKYADAVSGLEVVAHVVEFRFHAPGLIPPAFGRYTLSVR